MGIWHRGHFVGAIGTLPIDHPNKKVEFGYWIDEASQGHGFVTMTAKLLLARLFDEMGMNRTELHIRTDNSRSRAVAERLGFTLESTKRQADKIGGEFVDMHYFGLLREEWETRRAINEQNTDGYIAPACPG